MKKNTNISERINYLIEYQGITINDFAKKIGYGRSQAVYDIINGKSKPSFDFFDKLYNSEFSESINAEWLLTGNGEMIKNSRMVNEPAAVYGLKTDRVISDHQQIPLYNIEASAGIVTLFNDTSQTTPIDYIQIPNLPKCDGAIYVTGDSMYPLLKSGDIVMYKQVHNIKDGIFWGEMYLVSMDIDGEEHVTVKYIQKSEKGEDHVKLVSQNKHHQDKDIKLRKIRALALIKASVRINSMS